MKFITSETNFYKVGKGKKSASNMGLARAVSASRQSALPLKSNKRSTIQIARPTSCVGEYNTQQQHTSNTIMFTTVGLFKDASFSVPPS